MEEHRTRRRVGRRPAGELPSVSERDRDSPPDTAPILFTRPPLRWCADVERPRHARGLRAPRPSRSGRVVSAASGKEGLVPGVLYGGDTRARSRRGARARTALTGASGLHAILDVVIDGQKTAHHAVLKEFQLTDPRTLTHVDLHEVRLDRPIQAQVPSSSSAIPGGRRAASSSSSCASCVSKRCRRRCPTASNPTSPLEIGDTVPARRPAAPKASRSSTTRRPWSRPVDPPRHRSSSRRPTPRPPTRQRPRSCRGGRGRGRRGRGPPRPRRGEPSRQE